MNNQIIHHKGEHYFKTNNGYKKIVATTDSSLKHLGRTTFNGADIYITPRPSNSFLEAYVRKFNKSNKIESILVEYNAPVCKCDSIEKVMKCCYSFGDDCKAPNPNNDFYGLKPKIAPDNTITIKSIDLPKPKIDTSCTIGVGSGDTGLFVHGNYEAIKALQEKLIRNTYTEEELFLNMQYYMEHCEREGYCTPQVWLAKFKHF